MKTSIQIYLLYTYQLLRLGGNGSTSAYLGLWLLAWPLLFSPAPAQGQCFLPASTYGVGDRPSAVAVADLNGDQIPDLVTANAGSDNVSVLLGRDGGGFAPATQHAVGAWPVAVAVADLNGDQIPDLVTANEALSAISSSSLSVLLGQSGGGFAPAANYYTSGRPTSVVVADVNGDQIPDLVAARNIGDVLVLPGRGGGDFVSNSLETYLMGGGTTSVAVADLNGDRLPDLVTANSFDNNVTVRLGLVGGGFGPRNVMPATKYGVGDRPSSVAVADVNGDQIPDIVTANADSDDISVLLGQGDGGFAAAVNYAVGDRPTSVAVADLNGDHIPDIVTGNASSANVSVLLGQAGGGFGLAANYAAGNTFSVAAADVNGDRIPDIVTADVGRKNVNVLLGQNGGFAPAASYTMGDRPSAVAVADLNGDQLPDIVSANTGSANVSVRLGQAGGGFGPAANYAAGSTFSVAVADVNGDRIPDIVTADAGRINVNVLLGQAGGGFAPAVSYAVGGNRPSAVAVADLNGDQIPDLVTANAGSDNVSVLLGRDGGGFAPATQHAVGAWPVAVAVADLNGDQIPDLVTANEALSAISSSSLSVLLGQSGGEFAPAANYYTSGRPTSVVVADVNGDQIPDLVAARNIGDVLVLPGRGGGDFVSNSLETYLMGGGTTSVAVADLNGDRLPDLVTANSFDNNVTVRLGLVGGGFGPRNVMPATKYGVGDRPSSVAVADVNGDQIPDIVTANADSDDVSVLLGNRPASISQQPVTSFEACAGFNVSTSVSTTGTVVGYQWYKNGTSLGSAQQAATLSLTNVQPNDAGAYKVEVIGFCNSVISKEFNLTVNPLPTVYTVTGGGAYCAGGTGVAVGLSGSQNGVNYQLKRDGDNVDSPVAGTGAALSFGDQTATGTYTIAATYASANCTIDMSGSANVTVKALPDASFTRLAGPYCADASPVTLMPTVDGGTFTGPGVVGNTFIPTHAGSGGTITYTVVVNGCTNTSSQNVTVRPPINLTISSNTSVIYGYGSNCTTLSASANGGTGTLRLAWSNGATGTSTQVCPTQTTTYTVTATDINGCTSVPTQVTVHVQDVRCGNKYDKVVVCHQGKELCVSPNAVEAHLGHGDKLGGCSNGTARIGQEAPSAEGVPLQLSLKAYPNPTQDAVTVEVLTPTAGMATCDVLDAAGRARQTRQQELIEGLNELEFKLGSLPAGVYLIRVTDALNRQGSVRVSKQ